MLASIQAFFSTTLGTGIGATISSLIAAWALGHLTETDIYKSIRAKYGILLYNFGALVSKFGEMRLGKALWAPIEKVLMDFIFFGAEQVGAGLRSDNIDKLESHLNRLSDVGSVVRADAIAEKLDSLKNPSQIPLQAVQDAAQEAKDVGGLKE